MEIILKIFTYSLTFFILSNQSMAQSIDSAYIKCSYKLTYIIDSTKPSFKQTDIQNLLIGKKVSYYFSYLQFQSDSMLKSDIDSHVITYEELLKNPALKNKYSKRGLFLKNKLYINFPENKITTLDKVALNDYYFEEEIENLTWSILPDTMTVLNFLCQKAIINFHGRNYLAWFTNEIPISSGPYKFHNLPGLILNISDTKGNYVYECIGVERLLIKQPILISKNTYIKTTRNEFRRVLKNSFDNPYETLMSGSNFAISGPDADKFKAALQKGLPYNPIELE